MLALQKILVKAKQEISNFALHAQQMVRNNKKVSSVALIPETRMRLCGLKLTPTLGTAALVVLQQVQFPASIADRSPLPALPQPSGLLFGVHPKLLGVTPIHLEMDTIIFLGFKEHTY